MTSAGLLLEVANVREALELWRLVRKAERTRDCRSIISSRGIESKERKRRGTIADTESIRLFHLKADEL